MKSTKVLLLAVFVLILVCINPSTAAVPVAQFRGAPITGSAPLVVTFTDQSTGSPYGWVWFFGDENFTAPWTPMNASSGWTAREYHRSVALPDGSIVLMGGYDTNSGQLNDTWRSTDNGTTWTLMNASSGWMARDYHSSVALPDSSIVLMGGYNGGLINYNDVWRSTNNGTTWIEINSSAGWSARSQFSSVALPDSSIVLMGGLGGPLINDTWRSTDKGATWTLMNASSGWTARYQHSSVALPDGSIILMGGADDMSGIYKNDTWRSTDKGATWTLMNASSGWTARYMHNCVALPDGSIILIGGAAIDGLKNDTWRSTDNGATWMKVNASSGWTERKNPSSVAMPDSSIVLMGGWTFSGYKNDTWRFQPAGSSAQNPSHTYTKLGKYNVALQAYNTNGYNSTRKTGYITVANLTTKIGIYKDGVWYLDWNGNGTWDSGIDNSYNFGAPLWTPVVGDWNSTGKTYIGITNGQQWYLDWNGNGAWDGADKAYSFGAPGWLNVTGDWNHDGKTEIGVTNGQQWYLDNDGSGTWNVGDKAYNFGAPGWIPLVGDWNPAVTGAKIGLYKDGIWYLDWNGNGAWDNGIDRAYSFGAPDWTPIVGDWNTTGSSYIGVTNGQQWYLDWNGNGAWDGADKAYSFGAPGWTPVIGDWNGDGKVKIGVTNSQQWYLDSNGNGAWNNGIDYAYSFGAPGWTPIVGKWS